MKKLDFQKLNSTQTGQTLIETVAAIFILVMGITAAVGLAVYAFGNSTNITKQIVAVGLAREGVEAVKNMRDTNWLKLNLATDCHDFSDLTPPNTNAGRCYKNTIASLLTNIAWLDDGWEDGFLISPSLFGAQDTKTFWLQINNDADKKAWDLSMNILSNSNFGLDENEDFAAASFKGAYVPRTNSPHGTSEFYRKITLTNDGDNRLTPYSTGSVGNRLQVISQVWWTDKKCPRVTDYSLAKPACRVELQTYLTNWKDY